MVEDEAAPPDAQYLDRQLQELRSAFATRAEDSRKWLVASVLTLAAGSLAFQAASTDSLVGLKAAHMISLTLFSLSLLSGVGAVFLQFIGAGLRSKQLGHAVQSNRDWALYDIMLKANDRALADRKKETAEAAERQKAKAELQGRSEMQAARWAALGEKYATPFAIVQVLAWLVGFAVLIIVILK